MPLSEAQISERFVPSRFGYEDVTKKRKRHRHPTRSTRLSSESSGSSDCDVWAIGSAQHKASPRGRRSKRGRLCTWTLLVGTMLCVFAAMLATGLTHQHGLKDNVYALKFYAMAASWPPWPVFSAVNDTIHQVAFEEVEEDIDEHVEELLEEVEEDIEEHIEEPLKDDLPSAIARRDFALESEGASIDPSLTTDGYLHYFLPWRGSPSLVIRGDEANPCWLVNARAAHIGVVLGQPIYPTHATIDYESLSTAIDASDAPRSMILWGLVDGNDNSARYDALDIPSEIRRVSSQFLSKRFVPLGEFEYNLTRPSPQMFALYDHIRSSPVDFTTLVLDIKSNWGSQKTRLCHLRLHGDPALV